jgi:hypothetical protein
MKQVKCWAYVRTDGVVARMEAEKPIDTTEIGVGGSRWVEMTGEMPEAEKTCEIKWDEGRGWWAMRRGGIISSGWGSLRAAMALANDNGWTVTNDPREVHSGPQGVAWALRWFDGEQHAVLFSCEENAKAYAVKHGWRILSKEPAQQRPTLGELLGVWRTSPCNNWDPLLNALLGRIVEAIGRDKR